jgi:hypothetical protein
MPVVAKASFATGSQIAVTKAYLRGLLLFGPALFSWPGWDPQPRPDVVIGVVAIHGNTERAGGLAARLASPSATELLSALLADKDSELITRSRLRPTDGGRLHFQIGADVAIDVNAVSLAGKRAMLISGDRSGVLPFPKPQPRGEDGAASGVVSVNPSFVHNPRRLNFGWAPIRKRIPI